MVKKIYFITVILAIALSFLPASIKLTITRYPRLLFLLPLNSITAILTNFKNHRHAYLKLSEHTVELTLENAQLKEKLRKEEFSSQLPKLQLVPAQIIARDQEIGLRYLTINKGSKDGIKNDMPVLTPYGLVGKIIETNPKHSIIETALSPSLKISALDLRSNVVGVIEYSHFNKLRFKYAFAESDIQINDTIITSGLGGIFPRGIYIGTVLSISPDATNFFQYVDIQPLVTFNTLENVFVLTQPTYPIQPSSFRHERFRNLYDLKIEAPLTPRIR